jgi:hypothetical protein
MDAMIDDRAFAQISGYIAAARGSPLNLHRWRSPRTIKKTFVLPRAVEYPFLSEE